jgi:cytochrome c oxidase subunit 2
MLHSLTLLANTESEGSFWLPPQASSVASSTDELFHFILWLSAFFFVLIIAAIVLFMFRYRRRRAGQQTADIEGNTRLEIAWAVIPTLLLVVLFFWGFRGYMNLAVPPADALDIRVVAEKWKWNFVYPDDGIEVSGKIEGDVNDPFVVPVNQPVKLTMSSKDVIHSFYVPAFRVKKDVVPNRYSVLWFEAEREGVFDVMCAEYCGAGHSTMIAKIKVVSESAYREWLQTAGGPADGSKLFVTKGCNACHSITTDGKGLPGPPLAKKYGAMEMLADGSQVKVDDNYIRESIMQPNAKVVRGYQPVMPTFAGQLSEEQLNALVDYIKSLK